MGPEVPVIAVPVAQLGLVQSPGEMKAALGRGWVVREVLKVEEMWGAGQKCLRR